MNEFKGKLYLKYKNIEYMMQLLCLKLYRLRLFIQATPVPISVSELSNPSSRRNPKLLIKKNIVY